MDPQHTVIAVHVEHETGVLGDSQNRALAADVTWTAQVLAALLAVLAHNKGSLKPSLKESWQRSGYRQSRSWALVSGDDWQAEELFKGWRPSSFFQQVAAVGKGRLAPPKYANELLDPQKSLDSAGIYPSDEPVQLGFDQWRAGAPSLDWLSPDIYVDDFAKWVAAYFRPEPRCLFPSRDLLSATCSRRWVSSVPQNSPRSALGRGRPAIRVPTIACAPCPTASHSTRDSAIFAVVCR